MDNSKFQQSLLGVDFIAPVDNYRMVERSIKYVMLFLLLTFVAVWLIEVTAKVRVHLLQYLLLGMGMCLFYLLLLALSEHIGYVWAYVIASVAVIGMTTLYSKYGTQNRKACSVDRQWHIGVVSVFVLVVARAKLFFIVWLHWRIYASGHSHVRNTQYRLV